MKFPKILLFLLFAYSYIKISKSTSDEEKIRTSSKAIASLMDHVTDEHRINFRIVTFLDDNFSKRISNKILSLSSSIVHSEELTNMSEFTYIYGKTYILITKMGMLAELGRRRLETSSVDHPSF